MIPSHYLQIPFSLQEWFPGGAPENWRNVIHDDAWKGGRRLILETLPPNDRGDRVAIRGERFYYEAGRDRKRSDTIFLMRIEPAEHRVRRETSRSYACRLLPLLGAASPPLNPVDPIFGPSVTATTIEARPLEDVIESDVAEPSPLLLGLLQKAPEDVRSLFRPVPEVEEPSDVTAFLDPLQRLWRRPGIDVYVTPTPRQERLLLGGVIPVQLGRKERDGLLQIFGVGLLNRMLGRGLKADELYDFLRLLSAIPAVPRLRSVVWSSGLRGLAPDALRRELHECAPTLQRFVVEGTDAEGAWEEGILVAIRDGANRADDAGLKELVAKAESADDPLAIVGLWADRLQFAPSVEQVLGADMPVSSSAQTPASDSVPSGAAEVLPISAFEAWLVRASLPAAEQPNSELAELQRVSQEVVNLQLPLARPSDISRTIHLLDKILAASQRVRHDLPELPEFEDALATADRLLNQCRALLGPDTDALLTDPSVTPEVLQDIVDLLATDGVDGLPHWIWWPDAEESPNRKPSLVEMATALVDLDRRRVVKQVLGYVKQLAEPGVLRWLRPPDPDAGVGHHVRAWFEGARELLNTLSPEDRASLLASGDGGADPSQVRHDQELLAAVCDELSPAVAIEIKNEVRLTPLGPARTVLVRDYRTALDFFRREFGDTTVATYQALKNRVTKQREAPSQSRAGTEAAPLQLEHNWVETSGTRATLVFRQPDPSVAWGYLDAPIVIESDRLQDFQIRLEFEVKGDHRRGWPPEWPGLEPSGAFRVPMFTWRRDPEHKSYQISKIVRVPIRVPTDENPRLELLVRALDPVTGQRLSHDKSLRWDSISTKAVEVTSQWVGTTNPAYVKQHPIGPQLNVNTLLDRLEKGSSVAIVAPRRFGKSTLVEYLHAELAKRNCLTPKAIICTLMMGPGGLDYSRFWETFSDSLQSLLDVGMPRSTTGSPLPDDRAFDSVRRAAKAKGFGAIVLLVDEAQLFFPRHQGRQLGTQLKTKLERDWSRVDKPSMAPLRIAFVGLPSLPDRAGTDLMGLLMPVERSEMREDELRPLIAAMVRNLQTTRAARLKLIESAGNLFILRVLLERVSDRVNREGRIWCNDDDVRVVAGELEDDLKNGRENTLAQYIRDALNDADLVNEWEPMPSLPVAAALAPACHSGQSFDAAVQAATVQLNHWGRLSQTDDKQLVSPTYDLNLVRRHVARLEERRVMQNGQFTTRLLQAWLVGVNRIGTFDTVFQAALFRGSQRRIRIPSGVDPVGEGLEARVYRMDHLAYRVRPLASETERQRFLESCQMLDALRVGHVKREPGSDYLFDLQEIGLSATNADEAVQVYPWIPGEDLSGKVGALNPDYA